MSRGPLEFVVLEFPEEIPGRTIAPALADQIDRSVITLVDMAFVATAPDGSHTVYEAADRDGEPDYDAFEPVVQTMDGLISDTDLAEIAGGLTPGSRAAVFLFENTWMERLRSAITEAGGSVVYAEHIPGPVADAVEAIRIG